MEFPFLAPLTSNSNKSQGSDFSYEAAQRRARSSLCHVLPMPSENHAARENHSGLCHPALLPTASPIPSVVLPSSGCRNTSSIPAQMSAKGPRAWYRSTAWASRRVLLEQSVPQELPAPHGSVCGTRTRKKPAGKGCMLSSLLKCCSTETINLYK